MSEFRQDRTSGRWAIIAPQRGRRPRPRVGPARPAAPPRFDPNCPFCPGHESELPAILAETPADGAPGWRVRVVPNKYPALRQDAPALSQPTPAARPAYGFHEVIIETPRHDGDPAAMEMDALGAVVAAYRDRVRVLLGRPGIDTAVLFRNKGAAAGASTAHPHAQVIATPMRPPRLAAIDAWGQQHHDNSGRCATCDELAFELQHGERIVEESAHFVSLVPFAAEHPCELWLVPKQHQASFAGLDGAALYDFALLLGNSLRRIKLALDDPPYNFAVESSSTRDLRAPHVHWRLRIVPEIAVSGGFELGTGLQINSSRPEDDTRRLRATNVSA